MWAMQEEAVSLLCSMAEFPFYRPAIRKANPAGDLAHMLEAGCHPVRACYRMYCLTTFNHACITTTTIALTSMWS